MAALVGTWFVNSNIVKKFHFYQETFGPAVMAACGKGFVQPTPEPEAMTVFLQGRVGNFDCNSILPEQKAVPPDLFQGAHRNLMLTVAGWWRAFGVSWTGLTTLYGMIFGLSAGFTYVLLRTAMQRPLAFLLTCFFILSPPQLFNLPHLRDYIKAPFMLAAIAMIAWLLKGRVQPILMTRLLAATGLFIGIGIGFRIDLIILVPLFVAVILFMQPGPWLPDLRKRLVVAATFLVCFIVAASPTLISMRGGSNMPHVIILGLMEEFDQRLGIDPAHYGLGYHYLDMYANTLVSSFAYGASDVGTAISYPSTLYDSAGISYIVDVYKTFPADIFARYLAALWRILHLPIVAPVTFEDLYFFYDDYRPQWLMAVTHHPVWEIILIATISTCAILIAFKSFKLLIAVFLVICYLCGYPFLQFGVRHYFYLEVISLWIFGLCIQQIFLSPPRKWRDFLKSPHRGGATSASSRIWGSRGLRAIGAIVLIFGLPLALLGLTRIYQTNRLGTVFAAYASTPTEAVATERSNGNAGWNIFRLSDTSGLLNGATKPEDMKTISLVATFDSKSCGKDAVHIRFKYQSTAPTYEFSQTKSIGIDRHTRIFFPAFFRPGLSAFIGIEMPAEELSCLISIERLADTPPLRIPLTVTLPQNWMDLPRYRTFH